MASTLFAGTPMAGNPVLSNLASFLGQTPKPVDPNAQLGVFKGKHANTGSAAAIPNLGLDGWLDGSAATNGAPNVRNSAKALSMATQMFGQQMLGGRTSTILTGGQGENEAALNTSKILLGR